MEQINPKPEETNQQLLTKRFSNENLLNALKKTDKAAVNKHLAKFKQLGVVAFDKVLAINSNERLPAMIKTEEGREEVQIALTAAIKSAFGNFNLRVGLNEDQMIDLAEAIMDQSHEDNLAMEDVLLFLHRLVVGQAGKIYDRMDIPTFFELFEGYRQERHEKILQIRDEEHAQYKTLGRGEPRSVNTDGADAATLLSMMESLYSTNEDGDQD